MQRPFVPLSSAAQVEKLMTNPNKSHFTWNLQPSGGRLSRFRQVHSSPGFAFYIRVCYLRKYVGINLTYQKQKLSYYLRPASPASHISFPFHSWLPSTNSLSLHPVQLRNPHKIHILLALPSIEFAKAPSPTSFCRSRAVSPPVCQTSLPILSA